VVVVGQDGLGLDAAPQQRHAARAGRAAAGVVRPDAWPAISVKSGLLVAFGDGIESDALSLSWGSL